MKLPIKNDFELGVLAGIHVWNIGNVISLLLHLEILSIFLALAPWRFFFSE